MYKIPSEQTSFDLDRFLKKHQLENQICGALPAGEEFESFVKKYFEDLAVLFDNELNDQITGKDFENHWQEEMDEFNDRYR